MILKLFAAPDRMVPIPWAPADVVRFFGRTFDDVTKTFPADEKPVEIDSARAAQVNELRPYVRDRSLLPADALTAKFFQVEHAPGAVAKGVWAANAKAQAAPKGDS